MCDEAPADQAGSVSGLSALVARLGREPWKFEPVQNTHKVWPLQAQMLTLFAAALEQGGDRVTERLADAGLGLRYGDALSGHVTLIRRAFAENVQSIQLPSIYAPMRTANRRLWLALLRGRHPRLLEQVLLANIVEAFVSDWLPDDNVLKVEGSGLTFSFARHLGTVLVRTEAVELLEALQQRARTSGALASELVRHARRHGLAAAEKEWRQSKGVASGRRLFLLLTSPVERQTEG